MGRVSHFVSGVLLLSSSVCLGGCDGLFPPEPDESELLDGPIEGLVREQVHRHQLGDALFDKVFSPEEGLGPLFVSTSCVSCHAGEGKGHPAFGLTRFGAVGADGVFTPLRELGGPQLQSRAVPGFSPKRLPAEATGVSRLLGPIVGGLGYLEAVDDTVLLGFQEANAQRTDGIRGRVQLLDPDGFLVPVTSLEELLAAFGPGRGTRVDGQYIGRFGWKASSINLLQQTLTALHQDMGLTTEMMPWEIEHPELGPLHLDGVPQPNVPLSDAKTIAFYLQTLKHPPRRNVDAPEVVAGDELFRAVKCAVCHVPTLRTGRQRVPELNEVEFHPYTDLLLHDMGPELDDGYTEGGAATSEWRTAPLWGLGIAELSQGGRAYYLHDGRARTLREAIGFHGGEAAESRALFNDLSPEEQAQLLAYLRSL